jgi:pseudaminic acid cytidylyltransferase
MRVAIIPARGGSKRIPRKNVRAFAGSPMISHSIKAARESGVFERIIVSTDDEEIASIALACGAEVPFKRPAEFSGDHVTTVDAVSHAVSWLVDHGCPVEDACCIYATAPLVHSRDIAGALRLMLERRWDYVFAATSFAYPILRAIQLTDDGAVKMLFPEHVHTRSQDLPEAWHDAGQFYWGRTEAWLNRVPIIGATSTVFAIPRWRVQDIDSLHDWEYAELLYKVAAESQAAVFSGQSVPMDSAARA